MNEDALRALAQAYDREDSAQRGEPDPWNLDDPGDIGDSDTWVSERLACARVAAEAFLSALEPAAPEGRQDDDRIRREMDEILRKQSERDIPFVPSTRPSEQAVTEAMVRIRDYADKPHADRYVIRNMAEAALKAAMEAGRHD